MTVRVLVGEALDQLRTLPDGSARMCVTSPPYWGLRNYGVDGQIGLEATPDAWVAALVAVFREVRRVLADDGTLWLNVGDCYNNAGSSKNGEGLDGVRRGGATGPDGETGYKKRDFRHTLKGVGIKHKDLVGLPWMLAFALRGDGWWLRSDIVWHKPNPMPESVTDRPTKSHEFVFLLSKAARYYYDAEAIRTEAKAPTAKMPDGRDSGSGAHGTIHRNGREKGTKTDKQRGHGRRHAGFNDRWDAMERGEQQADGGNARDVWTIPVAGFPGAHFATFPPELPRRCILAGSAVGDTVLDPFGGAGTTGLVADRLGRNAVLIELNPEYAVMAERRIHADAPLFAARGEE